MGEEAPKPAKRKPQRVGEYIAENGHEIAVYASGAEYDTVDGLLVKPARDTAITAENARDYQARSTARKREVMLAASNQVVQNKRLIEQYGTYAAVAERAQTLQTIATTPDAGKAAVMAHQALTLDTGMAEAKQQQAEQGSDSTRELIHDLADIARAALAGRRTDAPASQPTE